MERESNEGDNVQNDCLEKLFVAHLHVVSEKIEKFRSQIAVFPHINPDSHTIIRIRDGFISQYDISYHNNIRRKEMFFFVVDGPNVL